MHRPFRCHPNPSTLALLALFTGAAAQAQTPEGAYPYLGAGIGQARPRLDAARLGAAALSGSELTITSTSSDQRDTTYKLFGGLQFNRYLGVELSYFRLGQFSYRAITSPAGQLDGRLKVAGMNLDLVGSLPFSEDLSGLVRVGYQRARTSADWSGSGAVAGASRSARTNDSAPRYGVGLQYAVTQQFLMRLEAER